MCGVNQYQIVGLFSLSIPIIKQKKKNVNVSHSELSSRNKNRISSFFFFLILREKNQTTDIDPFFICIPVFINMRLSFLIELVRKKKKKKKGCPCSLSNQVVSLFHTLDDIQRSSIKKKNLILTLHVKPILSGCFHLRYVGLCILICLPRLVSSHEIRSHG